LLGSRVISFTITTYTDEQTYAQLIQQELDATGNFKVSLDVMPEAAYTRTARPRRGWPRR